MSRLGTVLFLSSLLLVGCGGDDTGGNPFVVPDSGPDIVDGGMPDAYVEPPAPIRDAGPVPDAAVDVNGPTVTVLSPTAPAMGDYTSDAILTADRVAVRCSAVENPAGDILDRNSVRAIVHDDAGTWVEIPALPDGIGDEFSAEVSLLGFETGAITVRCLASDTAGRTNSDEVDTFVDHGPSIQFFSPTVDGRYARQVRVLFSVTAVPVAADDMLAAVQYATVTASLSGYPLTNLTRTATNFEGTVVFDDPIFDLPLVGEHRLTVEANNHRMPAQTFVESHLDFVIDEEEGPDITILAPEAAEVISGIVRVRARISDPDGVVYSTVVATIAGREFPLSEISAGTYEGSYDTHRLGNMMVFPNIIVRAQDSFGNQGQNGFIVTLDNRGPIADLDPPEDFEEMKPAVDGFLCSQPFDPVGSDAQNDGDVDVFQLSKYRARVQDIGNGSVALSEPGVFVPTAAVDQDDVQLYVLDDTSQPIVVDTNGDGFCDELNPHLIPTTVPQFANEMARLDLLGITPAGTAEYYGATPRPVCVGDLLLADPICAVTSPEVFRIIPDEDLETPVIFGVPPVTELQCLGNGFDSQATNIQDGWACLAVRATDTVDNIGVSKPLRICYDHDNSGGDCAGPMPDCTGTYDPVTNIVDPSTPCTQEISFPSGEIRTLND